jgi:capsular exopolysaccharide synthesis family protein
MVNKKVYSFLLEKRAEMQINRSSIVARTRILNPPEVTGPVRPRRGLVLLVGLILGLIVGTAQAFARAMLGGKVSALQEVKSQTDIPVYAALPEMRSKRSFYHYLEAMRGLWVNLTFLKIPAERGKIICITSTIPGEGKTLTAANLARTIAKGVESRVVVLDLDMRRAKLHKVLGVPNETGISTLLSRHCSLEEAIQKTEIENLHVITSGPASENPVGLILSFALESLLEELSDRYDYVILDTPPVGLVSDASKVIRHSDLTLFVLRVGLSQKRFIEEIELLKMDEDVRFGLVVNGVKEENEYGYYKHYEYLDKYLLNQKRGELFQ